MRAIFNLIRGYDAQFNEFELAIFSALSGKLDLELQARLQKRLDRIQRIYRLQGGREINLYGAKSDLARDTSLNNVEGEFCLANFKIHSNDVMTSLSGRIFTVNGVLFSLEFNDPIEHAEAWQIGNIEMVLNI